MTAILMGGPFDGETVEVVGVRYERTVAHSRFAPPQEWKVAIYIWDRLDGKLIGTFAGLSPWLSSG